MSDGPTRDYTPSSLQGLDYAQPTADAPRPRGKRHSVKPWRDEVREMIVADRRRAFEFLRTCECGTTYDASSSRCQSGQCGRCSLPWYRRLFG